MYWIVFLILLGIYQLAYSAEESFGLTRINDKGFYVPTTVDKNSSDSYRKSVALIDKTWDYIRVIHEFAKVKDFERAKQMILNIYDGNDDVNFDTFTGMVGDEIVKIFYQSGDLKNAIRYKWRFLLYSGKNKYHNDLVELLALEEEYKKQVGEEKYQEETAAYPHKVDIDETFITWRLKQFMAKGIKYELYKQELLAREHFIRGHYEETVALLSEELRILEKNRLILMWDDWWKYGEEGTREDLIYVYVLMGKYREAKDQTMWQLKHAKDKKRQYGQTLKTLNYAINNKLFPQDLGYIYDNHHPVLVVRAKNYNRLNTDTFGPKDEIVKPLAIS